MPNFALVENDKVINVIVAESKELAEQLTGLEAIETNGEIWTDWTRTEGVWQKPVISDAVEAVEIAPTEEETKAALLQRLNITEEELRLLLS